MEGQQGFLFISEATDRPRKSAFAAAMNFWPSTLERVPL
jgi:hypothetical protein